LASKSSLEDWATRTIRAIANDSRFDQPKRVGISLERRLKARAIGLRAAGLRAVRLRIFANSHFAPHGCVFEGEAHQDGDGFRDWGRFAFVEAVLVTAHSSLVDAKRLGEGRSCEAERGADLFEFVGGHGPVLANFAA
jgi:hypothetical protein